ncbi:MAG TPA: glycine--tRNA ligase [Candidatus Saccharimonadales bacterium]|nr:glycine--tRNA ligase [Candidatus Saccharimonadales bacterium]
MSNTEVTLDSIVNLAKRRGFVFQASEIYGGLAGFWDYGPYGVELVNNIKQLWWRAMVFENREIYGVDGAIIQNPKLWKASGHVAGFTDPMVEDTKNGKRYRADHLANTDSTDLNELKELLKDVKSPDGNPLSEPRVFNMMMKTWIGPIESDDSVAYLRPETAGSIFTNYEQVRETTRSKIPFGIAQVGKAFRNEISPRDFIFRVRELEQMEMQYFIAPDMQGEQYERWREFAWKFLTERLKINEKNLQWHEHGADERAHYAAAAHDIYFKFPQGFKELWGTHNRTDFDLSSHMKESGRDLSYFNEATRERFVPNVIESSVGVGRMMLAALTDAYTEEEVNGETRVVLKLAPEIAPVKVAILPLSKKPELSALSEKVYTDLVRSTGYNIEYDETQSIGKRYRRQDEIGTPYCVTVDFESLEDNMVTVRNRDTMEQKRVKIEELRSELVGL